MVVTAIPPMGLTAFAETSSDWNYYLSGNHATIRGYKGTATELTIPSEIDGYIVTGIENDTFYGCTSLESITVGNGNNVYDSRNNCNAIIETATNTLIMGCKNTDIPDSVTNIGGSAFYNYSSLTNITIPNSVTSIGYDRF